MKMDLTPCQLLNQSLSFLSGKFQSIQYRVYWSSFYILYGVLCEYVIQEKLEKPSAAAI